MKCKKDKVGLNCYRANVYPYESGRKCPMCQMEWSHRQLSLMLAGGHMMEVIFNKNDKEYYSVMRNG